MRHQSRRVRPPIHHEVRTLRHPRPGAAQRLHIAIAQRRTHGAGANKRRVAHNKVSLRPRRLTRVCVSPLRHQRRLIGHLRARDRVGFESGAVPATQQLAVGTIGGDKRVPGQHRIAALDVAVIVHHRLGHRRVALRANVPLQKANPQHQLRQRSGALIDFNAAQLLQRDGFALKTQLLLGVAQSLQLVEHLALQALEVLQRHIQEITTSTGWVQHARGAQLMVKFFDLGASLCQLVRRRLALQRGGLARQHQRGGLGVGPVGAQRCNHRGQHQPLHIGARRVVRAQGVALGGVERALQQGAKNGRLHLAPVGLGGANQQIDLRRGEQQAVALKRAALEQLAVELEHRLGQRRAEAAAVHVGPQNAQHVLQRGGVVAVSLEQAHKSTFGQQLHVFGKHAEEATREVSRYNFRNYWRLLQMG